MTERTGRSVRRAMHLANANATLWAIGNGLVSTLLVVYLAQELGATGIAVSLILAAPRFAGLLRLATPAFVSNGNQRKRLCIAGYLTSGVMLLTMPVFAAPTGSGESGRVATLVACWCLYHLLEYIATICLWSWLGDWMPPPLRGRLIAWRERYLVAGRIAGIAASVSLATVWTWLDPNTARWQPLAWSATTGALLMLLAVVPLMWLPVIDRPSSQPRRSTIRELLAMLVDPAYRRLLVYSCWHAISSGITGTAQSMYPFRVLGIDYTKMVGLRSMMYVGQMALAPVVGRWVDHRGTRLLLTTAQAIVATGPLFFLFATPEHVWWIAGAYVVWMAYAAVNVGLDSLKLRLVPTGNSGPALAVYYAVGDLASGITMVAAGTWYDRLAAGGADALTLYAQLFVLGWILRTLGAVLAWRIPEASDQENQEIA